MHGGQHTRTGHEGPGMSTLSLTLALDGGGWSTPRPGRLTPEKDPVPIVYEAGMAPVPVWTGAENLAHTEIRSPDRSARSEQCKGQNCKARPQNRSFQAERGSRGIALLFL